MSRVVYGSLPATAVKAMAANMKQTVERTRYEVLTGKHQFGNCYTPPPPPRWRLRSKKKTGKHRIYLLWDYGQFVGEFPSSKARRAYIDATLSLEAANENTPQMDGSRL